MEIERLMKSDLAPLAELYKQFWGEDSPLPKMQATFQRLENNPNYIFLVAKLDHQLVGSVMGIICEELYGECNPFMVIEDVIVDKRQTRKGIGSQLMRELESIAVERECGYIIFVTECERTEAHRFYESLGYKSDTHKGFKKRLVEQTESLAGIRKGLESMENGEGIPAEKAFEKLRKKHKITRGK
jgi:ribosomal protein S18 acetylase RimI-like enzyme